MTRTRVLVGLFLLLMVVVAIAGPGHVISLVIVIGAAFLGVVALGVGRGLRDGMAEARAEARREAAAGEPGEEASGGDTAG